MSRKRKFCFDLSGRSSEEKDRIIKRIEEVIEEDDSEPEGPEDPQSDVVDQDLTENPDQEE